MGDDIDGESQQRERGVDGRPIYGGGHAVTPVCMENQGNLAQHSCQYHLRSISTLIYIRFPQSME